MVFEFMSLTRSQISSLVSTRPWNCPTPPQPRPALNHARPAPEGCTDRNLGPSPLELKVRSISLQQSPASAFCRQLEARDARVVPGDPAKAASGFENKIRCAAWPIVWPSHFDLSWSSSSLVGNSTGLLLSNRPATDWHKTAERSHSCQAGSRVRRIDSYRPPFPAAPALVESFPPTGRRRHDCDVLG
jgi:hypothetical protein